MQLLPALGSAVDPSRPTRPLLQLREEVGPKVLSGLDPPPKRSFSAVNKKPELIERRRWELEQWLWRLTEVPQVANSAMMFHFCELDAASRLINRWGGAWVFAGAAEGKMGAGSWGSALCWAGWLLAASPSSIARWALGVSDESNCFRLSLLTSQDVVLQHEYPPTHLLSCSCRPGPQLSPTASVATDQPSGLPSYAPSWSGSEASEHTEAVDSEAAAGAGAGAAAGGTLRSAQSNHLQQQHQHQQQRRGDSGHIHVSPSGSSASVDSGAVSLLQPGPSGDLLAGLGE